MLVHIKRNVCRHNQAIHRGRSGILNPLREKFHRSVVNNAGMCSSFYFEDK